MSIIQFPGANGPGGEEPDPTLERLLAEPTGGQPPEEPPTPTPLWKSRWFLALVALSLLLIVAALIGLASGGVGPLAVPTATPAPPTPSLRDALTAIPVQ